MQVVDGDTLFKIVDGKQSLRDTSYVAEFLLTTNYSFLDRTDAIYSSMERNVDFTLPDGVAIIDPLFGISSSFDIRQFESFFSDNPSILINNATILFDIQEQPERDILENFYSFFRREMESSGLG